ncbi:MAG: hypothetical protein WCJ40_15805 [Planctomycetota bacterium]
MSRRRKGESRFTVVGTAWRGRRVLNFRKSIYSLALGEAESVPPAPTV